ncbi:MAG: HAMP domain-containing sensor histidine kinase [Bacteroidales bacterium]|nr:HAMP domain-containing sensor histidine kinase [Bacteroidales bacterium]
MLFGFSSSDSLKGNFPQALAYKDSTMALNDSIWNDKLNERAAALEAEANIDRQIRENELLRKREEESQQKILYQQISLALLALIIISIIAMLIVIYRGREKLKIMNVSLKEKNLMIEEKNKQLKEVNKTKDKFFSIIAHDLKGPIGTLIALLEELDEDYNAFDEAERKDIIRKLHSSGQNTYNLLLNLLEWSLSQRDVVANNPKNIDLHQKVEEVFGVLQTRAERKGILLINSIPEDGVTAYADPEMAATIFINLINNAIKFSEKGSRVEVSGHLLNDYAEVSITDQGIGMTNEMMGKLFELDSNSQRPGTNREQGTGLGLILCKEFVTNIGGKIEVQSAPGVGTEFTVTFPVQK